MAKKKAADHAAHVASKMAWRRGNRHGAHTTKRGRGWGVSIHEPRLVALLPAIVAGVELVEHEQKKRTYRRTFRDLYTDTVRRRPRRKRRPRPESLVRYDYNPLTGRGRYLPSNKRRRERARFRRRQKNEVSPV